MARDILAELGLPPPPQSPQNQAAQQAQGEIPNANQMPQEQQTQPGFDMGAQFNEQLMQHQQATPLQTFKQELSDEDYQRQLDEIIEQHPIRGRLALMMNDLPQWQQGAIKGLSQGADYLNKAFESTGIPKYAGAFGGGVAQEAANMGISAANLLPGVDIEHLDLGQYVKDRDLGTDVAFGGGRLTGGALVGGAAGKAANMLGRPSGAFGLATDIAKGAGLGYALGEDAEGGGRMTGAIVGGLLAPLTRITGSGISKTVNEDATALRGKYNGLYEGLFEQGEKEGLDAGLKVAKIAGKDTKSAFNKIGALFPDVTEAYNAAIKNPTLRSIHKAQSKLGEYIAAQSGNIERGGHLSEEALGLARKLEATLENQVSNTLAKSKSGLLDAYNTIQRGFATEAAPLLKNSLVAEHIANYKPSSVNRFINQISSGSKEADIFGQELGGKYGAQLLLNNLTKSIAGKAGIPLTFGAATTIYGDKIGDYISSAFEDMGAGGRDYGDY